MKTMMWYTKTNFSPLFYFFGILVFLALCSNFATPSNISSLKTASLETLCTSNQGSISDIRCDLSGKTNADRVDTWTKTQWILEDWVDGLKK